MQIRFYSAYKRPVPDTLDYKLHYSLAFLVTFETRKPLTFTCFVTLRYYSVLTVLLILNCTSSVGDDPYWMGTIVCLHQQLSQGMSMAL